MDSKTVPYVGPRPFKENERDRFFGRQREARELLALVLSESLVVFYAQSGAGKTSLVNTCLIPDLRAKGFQVLKGRVVGHAVPAIGAENVFVFDLLRSLAPARSSADSLSKLTINEFLSSLEDDSASLIDPDDEPVHRRRALIIDQFEELFSTHAEAWQEREGFFQQLSEALEKDPYLWVALVMRDDFIASLDPYAPLVPGRFRRRYYMQRLEQDRALEAIKGPVKDLRPFTEAAAKRLVDNLSSIKIQLPDDKSEDRPGQFVEPVQLQIVCQKLLQHLERLSPDGTQITEKDIQDVGDVDASLGDYYAAQVQEVAEQKQVSERKIRRWFTDKLISPGGVRTLVLREPGKMSSGLENEVIQALPYLIRVEQRGSSAFYELTHDRLVNPILTNNKNWDEENSSSLQRQAALWKEQKKNEGWLLTGPALVKEEQWAMEHPDELSEVEEEFLKACRDHQERIDAKRDYQRRELQLAQEREQEQKRFAEEQRLLAEEQKRLAQRNKFLSIVAATFALSFLVVSFWALTRQERAEELAATTVLEQAGKLHDTGFYEDSIEKFYLAKDLDPNIIAVFEDPNVLGNLCADLSLFGDPGDAQEVCDNAVSADPTNGVIRDRRGINRALLGNLQGATEDFEIAVRWYAGQNNDNLVQIRKDWIGQLQSGNNPLADKYVFGDLKAQALIESVRQLDNLDRHEEMVARFLEAKRLDPNVVPTVQDAGVLNNVCWWGSLYMHAPRVTDACERSVELTPADGNHIDSRGLNRALLGRYSEAIADFREAVEWFVENKQDEAIITKRRNWILALRRNQDPFTPAVLEELKHETPIEGS
jgi:tetratricopeptide (TPR) repeat protein